MDRNDSPVNRTLLQHLFSVPCHHGAPPINGVPSVNGASAGAGLETAHAALARGHRVSTLSHSVHALPAGENLPIVCSKRPTSRRRAGAPEARSVRGPTLTWAKMHEAVAAALGGR